MTVSIRPAQERDRGLIANIFNLYQHEFSAYSDEFTYLDDNGFFAADTVEEILPFGGGVFPYIVEVDGHNAGFVMVLGVPYAMKDCDWELAEIFIVRAARGTGAARQAALLAMEGRFGRWGLSVYENNSVARGFWTGLLKRSGVTFTVGASSHPGMLDMRFSR